VPSGGSSLSGDDAPTGNDGTAGADTVAGDAGTPNDEVRTDGNVDTVGEPFIIGKWLTFNVSSEASVNSAVAAMIRSATPIPGWLGRHCRD
jgi:hypothetical protein